MRLAAQLVELDPTAEQLDVFTTTVRHAASPATVSSLNTKNAKTVMARWY